ncbi:diguanylate cyclase [Vibrio tubiashii]|nr:diguanylate cyclase [Vibrio tubiashii]
MYKITLLFLSLLIVVQLLLLAMSHFFAVDSRYDLLFETNTLFLVIYLAYISLRTIRSNSLVNYGVGLLIVNSFYEVITEITYFNDIAARHPLIDSFLEDGLLQLSFLSLAFGITNMVTRVKENATIDELTGLHNRKKLNEITLDKFDLIYFDMDGLKLINDTQGHAQGDLMLVRFAQALRESISGEEQAFRLGGDEFAVVVSSGSGMAFIDKINTYLEGEEIKFSYGINSTTKTQFHEALIRSDEAMYKMKNAQRDNR